MKIRTCLFFLLFAGLCGPGCLQKHAEPVLTARDIDGVVAQMTEIMIRDITNPPLAARFFSYALLAGYEIISQNNASFKSMHGVLNEYPDLSKPDTVEGYSVHLSALLAVMETAKKLQPSGHFLDEYEQDFLDSCKKAGIPESVLQNSLRYASSVSRRILAYAQADGYNKSSTYPRYTVTDKEGCWYPTPPGYIAAVEPYFSYVRPFLLDSATQFEPEPPLPFSTEKHSPFFRQLTANYEAVNDSMPMINREIAAFWDCNPFAVQNEGHLMVGIKKISPGAHWLGIAGTACTKANKSFEESMQIVTTVSIGLMDAFICCWHEKYKSNRIRPETAIRKYIDPTWVPLLQTPPFPEYLSGHSVVSASSAVILTQFFGDNFHFTDSVEVNYGLPPRSFPSFNQAAIEAGISRFYGGIHFMDAIDRGREQGIKVGGLVVNKMYPR